jgi:hypothetical protein
MTQAAAEPVFPAKAGIHWSILDTGFRRCDEVFDGKKWHGPGARLTFE